MRLELYQVDAFTARVFGGNPAAVVPLERWLPDEVMQAVAAENNLSETAFFVPEDGAYHLRWFTPTTEVDLCGHATLATAHVLWRELEVGGEVLRFRSLGGDLAVRRDGDLLELDFPALPPSPAAAPVDLEDLLGRPPAEVLAVREVAGGSIYLATLETEAEVRATSPRLDAFLARGVHNLMVTAPGDEVDFVSRYFAPGSGIPEDPVTGSAHCTLAPYWAARLGREELRARQVSARGGDLRCRVLGDRVRIAGHAVLYLRGELAVPA